VTSSHLRRHAPSRKRLRKVRRDEVDIAIVVEASKILRADGFDETEFRQYLEAAGLVIAVPDETTLGWVRKVARQVAGAFMREGGGRL
jgi:hypothetical protein